MINEHPVRFDCRDVEISVESEQTWLCKWRVVSGFSAFPVRQKGHSVCIYWMNGEIVNAHAYIVSTSMPTYDDLRAFVLRETGQALPEEDTPRWWLWSDGHWSASNGDSGVRISMNSCKVWAKRADRDFKRDQALAAARLVGKHP